MTKNLCVLSICLMMGVVAVQAGTVQQNLGFDPEGTRIIEQNNASEVTSAWNTTNDMVVVGQTFSLTNETTLRALTLVKYNTKVYSGGTNDLNLWIGEYSTNNTVVSTNLLETFDLTDITLTNDYYFSLNLDADLVLPAGDYAFQFWPEQGDNTLSVKTGIGYPDGGLQRVKDPANIPMDAASSVDKDLTFGLHAEVVGAISNVVPIADGQDVSTVPNGDLAITLTGTDPDGVSNLVYTVVNSPTNGSLSGTAPDLTYSPDTDFEGMDSFTFSVSDGVYTSVPAAVIITVTNIPPTAGAQSVGTLQDTPVEITLSGSDPEGSNLTYSVVGLPTNGMVSATDTNVLTYMPNGGFTGSDSFTFTVNDGVHDSEPATVSVTVIPTGVEVAFGGLSADLARSNNLLNVAGSTNGLAVSGILTSGEFVYSISYTDMDLDGDTLADTLSFDVRVSAVNGTTYTFSETPGASVATIGSGSETVADGSPDVYLYNPSGRAWITGASSQGTLAGDSMIYTVENISATGTAGPLDASFLGFNGIVLAERTSFGHLTILGSGSGLDGYDWDGPSLSVTNFTMNPLYVTSAAGGGGMRWGVSTVDFAFSLSPTPPPTSVGDISISVIPGGSQIELSWPTVAGFYYGVLATDNLAHGTWDPVGISVLGTGGEVSATNDIPEDNQLFYRSYLED